MGQKLLIHEVATRSGFSRATLRYYEKIGLLPQPNRAASGYRAYDNAVLDQLAFIARAKRLGCTLDEVSSLLLAWSGGVCGTVQDQLRSVVADKIKTVHAQRDELDVTERDLRLASQSLERHRPTGPCDDNCGCIDTGSPSGTARSTAINLVAKPVSPTHEMAMACSLSAEGATTQLDQWAEILRHASIRQPIDDGFRVSFAPSVPIADLIRLTVSEQACCQFFRFAITVDTRGIALEIRSTTDGQTVIESFFGDHN